MPIRADYHTHPCQQGRGLDAMRAYAEAGLARGLETLVFTEHAPMGDTFDGNAHFLEFRELGAYRDHTLRLRDEYAGRLDLRLGIELDYHPDRLADIDRVLAFHPWDHVGGSLHPHLPMWSERLAGRAGAERTRFALAMTREAVDSGRYHAITHLDFFRWRRSDYDPRPHEDDFRALFELMAARDVALELNTSGRRKDFADFLPCETVWRWSLDYPLRRVLGSDAHVPDQVGAFFDEVETYGRDPEA